MGRLRGYATRFCRVPQHGRRKNGGTTGPILRHHSDMGDTEDRKIVPDVITAIAKGAGAVVAGGVGLGGAWLAYSALFVNHRLPLPDAIRAPRHRFSSASGGAVSWYGDDSGTGRPLVLVHAVTPWASAYEMRPLFERFRGSRPVYAIDLPGFGFSERTDRVYYPELYAETLLEWIEAYLPGAPQPVDVIALSLSCEFVALAASARPDLFHSLALVSPTGLADMGSAASDQILRLSSVPVWSQGFYDLLTTRAAIRHSLRKSFLRAPGEGMVHYAYLTSHQPGARFAPLHYMSGHLFTDGIHDVYSGLEMPVLVMADDDDYQDFDALPEFLSQHLDWRVASVPGARSMPHFENINGTALALDYFWQGLAAPVAAGQIG
jgi:pimeloyl-ACP methyl ester carboxylesterase